MDDTQPGWSLEELVGRSGVPARTIRYYITERLLPGPRARGKAASYDEEHLLRLRLIRELTERHQPLTEIGQRLAGLSREELRALLAEEERREIRLRRIADTRSPKEYVAELLARARQATTAIPVSPLAPVVHEQPAVYRQTPAAEAGPPTWRRWELAPGVELHVRGDVEDTRRQLVERILAVAQTPARPEQQAAARDTRSTTRGKARQ